MFRSRGVRWHSRHLLPIGCALKKLCSLSIDEPEWHKLPSGTYFLQEGPRKFMSWDPVYRLIKKIPRGKVTTYGELARALRLSGGARAVGYAMAACPSGRGIPWHRVIGAGGRLRIPEPHGSLQRRLLESEGVRIADDRIDMTTFGWSPARRRKRSAGERRRKGTP